MKNVFTLLFACLSLSAAAQNVQTMQFSVEVSNLWNKAKADEPVVIKLNEVNPAFKVRSAVVMNGNEEIASQLDDLNGDMKADELAFVIDMPAKSTKTLSVTLSSEKTDKKYPARVFAELYVRDAKKLKHGEVQSVTTPGTTNFYDNVLHHGPAFESELVGFRIYFNQKQTVDPYGKFNKGFEIKESQFYPTDEQLARGFGDDVLMVGNSCGIGTLKGWNGTEATHCEPVAFRTERIMAYGPIRTVTDIEVKGWEYQGKELTMTNRYILYGGHRDVKVETFFAEPLTDEVFATGVQNIMGTETVMDSDHKGLVGSWGRHWPVTDTVKYAKETVGIATYIPQKYVKKEVKDKDNFLYTLSAPGSDHFHHYTMFTSCKETFGFANSKEWFKYMKEWKQSLMNPVKITIKR